MRRRCVDGFGERAMRPVIHLATKMECDKQQASRQNSSNGDDCSLSWFRIVAGASSMASENESVVR